MNITLYINKRNEERFKEEAGKSKLVNELLDSHYSDQPMEWKQNLKTGDIEVKNIKTLSMKEYKAKKSQPKKEVKLDIPGVTKGVPTKNTGPLYHVLDQNDDTVDTLPLQDAIKLKNSHVGWDMVRA